MKTRLIDSPAVILCQWPPLSLSLPSCVAFPDFGCDFPSLVECWRWNASLACVCVWVRARLSGQTVCAVDSWCPGSLFCFVCLPFAGMLLKVSLSPTHFLRCEFSMFSFYGLQTSPSSPNNQSLVFFSAAHHSHSGQECLKKDIMFIILVWLDFWVCF